MGDKAPGPTLQKIEKCRKNKEFYWLMKTEPEVYSIDDLKTDKTAEWDGIRNYQARNFMMNDMNLKDKILIYHSNAKPSGIAGVAEVSKLAFPDPEQFNEKSKYYDAKSMPDNPRWHCVEVRFLHKFKAILSLEKIKNDLKNENMLLVQRGQRLSILPLLKSEFDYLYSSAENEN